MSAHADLLPRCSNCGKVGDTTPNRPNHKPSLTRGRCNACRLYFTRHGHERAFHLPACMDQREPPVDPSTIPDDPSPRACAARAIVALVRMDAFCR